MSVMNVLRRTAAPAAAGLAATALLAAGTPAQAATASPAAPAALHVAGTVGLGPVTPSFTYQFSEAPNGTVYFSRDRFVYAVSGTKAPVSVLHAGSNVLAVAASKTEFFVETGRTVRAYKVSNRHLVRSWTLPRSLGPLTSAGLYSVGSTLWAWTDWAKDGGSFQYANVYRIRTSSAAVHTVSKNTAYPADMAADGSGLYYEAIKRNATNGYLIRVTPSGHVTRHTDKYLGNPLTLAGGRVFLLGQHEPSSNVYLDAFSGSTLHAVFSRRESPKAYDVAGTGAGLLMLQSGRISRLSIATGRFAGALNMPHLVTLVAGPSAAVITYNSVSAFLLRLAG
jgi:hypothetical protein